jgi:hypothetical protein
MEKPCPGDRERSVDHTVWYGIPDDRDGTHDQTDRVPNDQRDGSHVANFAVCPRDLKSIEALLPSIRGYFTRLPSGSPDSGPGTFTCSLRTSSRGFPKYIDLLIELDAEAQRLGLQPNISRFVKMARENVFENECSRDKAMFGKSWHFHPRLPEFTVCPECFDEVIRPGIASASSNIILKLFNRPLNLVPGENLESGSSCCLYSPRMRKIWERSVENEDFAYLKRKAIERKQVENKLAKERDALITWMAGLERGTVEWERLKRDLNANKEEWREVE